MPNNGVEDVYPLSPVQQGILFHTLSAAESGVYLLQVVGSLPGQLNAAAFERAWQQVVDRHPILRTAFAWKGLDTPLQAVGSKVKLTLTQHDWRALSHHEQQSRLQEFLLSDRRQGFNISKAPLMRLSLFRLADDRYQCCWTSHHLLLDGWSMPIIFKEASAFYEAFMRGTELQLKQPRPYRDYIAWLQSQDLSGAESYWRRTLKGFTAPTPLGIDRVAYSELLNVDDYAQQQLELSTELSSALQRVSREKQVTLNTLMQGAWAVLLSRYSGERDVLFGTTVSGRPARLAGVEEMVGPFINTLPVRVRVSGEQPVLEWLKQLQAEHTEMRQYEHSPLVKVQGWSELPRDVPLFESNLIFENYPTHELHQPQYRNSGNNQIDYLERDGYPLAIVVLPGRATVLQAVYFAKRFHRSAIERMLVHLSTLLEVIAADPSLRVSELPLLSAAEVNALLLSSPHCATPQSSLLPLLAEQVNNSPQAPAVRTETGTLTYLELDRYSNVVAHLLHDGGVPAESIVAVLSERSAELLIAMLGIFKAGAAYLPLDPLQPAARVGQVLRGCGARVVLVSATLRPLLEEALTGITDGPRVLLLDDVLEAAEERGIDWQTAPEVVLEPQSLAYVIYTSGSTGVPKGAMVEHSGMLNHLLAKVADLSLSAADRVAQTASQCFDISVWQYLAVLLVGGTVEIVGDETAHDPRQLLTAVRERGISVLETVPSLLREMVRSEVEVATLRWLVVTGEALPAELVREWRARHGHVEVMNAYGPTECSDDVTHAVVTEVGEQEQWVCIGRAVRNTRLYVLDEQLRLAPVGVKGELYVGGDGVGRGYLGRPELTAERFVPDAYGDEPGERLYRTGDEVRWLASGELEFIGRVDQQVKVRGYRIELGEIESVLGKHEAVRDCVVVAREAAAGVKQLVGYVVAETEISREGLRGFLKERLPEYMVPATFVLLGQLPLTANGKVDRKALPEPEQQRAELEHSFVAPRSETEELLAGIWRQVLRVEQVGVDDNFFELGGDSILSIQIVARANQAGLQLVPRDLFVQPSVAGLAQLADSRTGSESIALAEQGVVTGSVPLTPVQQWFFEQRLAQPHHFNQSVMLEVPAEVEATLLAQVLKQLVLQHDALRMRFSRSAAGWRQRYAESETAEFFSFHDLSSLPASERAAALEAAASRLQASLNLEAGPVLRAALFRYAANEAQRLLLVIHHLVVDGVSWRILLEDVQRGYEQAARGEVITLGAKTSSFKQWAEQLNEYAQTAAIQEQISYWNEAGNVPVAQLPRDYRGGANTVASTRSINVKLDQEQTRALLQDVPGVYHTQINDVLLTALGRVLGEWSGAARVVVELEGHGREEIGGGVDVTRTVGWFTTLYPVMLEVPREAGIGAALKSVKEQLRGVPEKGIGYGLLRYMNQNEAHLEELKPEVSFNYLGQFGQAAAEQKGWRAARESTVDNESSDGERELLIEVNAGVGGGQLQVHWSYSTAVHAEETIRSLAQRYIEVLEELIEHCRSAEAGGFTPSDFPEAELDQEELDELVAEFSK